MHGPLSPDGLVRERPFIFLHHMHEKVGLFKVKKWNVLKIKKIKAIWKSQKIGTCMAIKK